MPAVEWAMIGASGLRIHLSSCFSGCCCFRLNVQWLLCLVHQLLDNFRGRLRACRILTRNAVIRIVTLRRQHSREIYVFFLFRVVHLILSLVHGLISQKGWSLASRGKYLSWEGSSLSSGFELAPEIFECLRESEISSVVLRLSIFWALIVRIWGLSTRWHQVCNLDLWTFGLF